MASENGSKKVEWWNLLYSYTLSCGCLLVLALLAVWSFTARQETIPWFVDLVLDLLG